MLLSLRETRALLVALLAAVARAWWVLRPDRARSSTRDGPVGSVVIS